MSKPVVMCRFFYGDTPLEDVTEACREMQEAMMDAGADERRVAVHLKVHSTPEFGPCVMAVAAIEPSEEDA